MNRYERGKVLGEGTFGVVFSAIQKSTGKQVAVKQFRRGKFKDGVNFTAIREIKLQMELSNHPNITKLIDVYIDMDTVNLVFEFLPVSLDDIIKCKEIILSTAHIKSYMKMLLEGLEHCHRCYVLHRDLKAENVLIGTNGHIKLADFGLARVYGSPNRNMTSMVCTIWYRPPELLFGAREYGASVDMWGVGCIFAELMLRVPLFPGLNEVDQLGKIFHVLGTPTEETWPGLTSLPNYVEFTPSTPLPLTHVFTAAPPDALDLLTQLLTLDPSRRVTATAALAHPYFTTHEPRATAPPDLPTLPGSSGGGSGGPAFSADDAPTDRPTGGR